MNIPRTILEQEDFKACAAFHGHTCMGLTLGYLAARLALDLLAQKGAADADLFCIAETDACACDAIQVLTGCTFGKGTLFHRDIGKMAFTFASRETGVGIRLAIRHEAMNAPAEERRLAELIRSGAASNEQKKTYQDMLESRSAALFAQGPTAFFSHERTSVTPPPRNRLAPSKICDGCGEPVMQTRLEQIDNRLVCRTCLHQKKIRNSETN